MLSVIIHAKSALARVSISALLALAILSHTELYQALRVGAIAGILMRGLTLIVLPAISPVLSALIAPRLGVLLAILEIIECNQAIHAYAKMGFSKIMLLCARLVITAVRPAMALIIIIASPVEAINIDSLLIIVAFAN